VEQLIQVKLFVNHQFPPISDGNNFGVSVLEEILNEISRAEESSFAVLDAVAKYFLNRSKLVSKCHKYPFVGDYAQSVYELDQREYLALKLCIVDMRNNYAVLHDLILKNIEKIKAPRPHHHMSSMF